MKFEKIFLDLLTEQVPPNLDAPDDQFPVDDDDREGRDPEEDEDVEDERDIDPNAPLLNPEQPLNKVPKPKKESANDKIKKKWKEERPELTDNIINDAIDIFNRRKNGLRVYKDPATNPEYINLPEITSMIISFPEMMPILTDITKLRDLQNFTWDQMEVYLDRLGTVQVAPIMDFKIEGDTPERRKASALKIWDATYNRIIDENGIRVFKITGVDEAIALGRLQHQLVDQYGGNYWCVTNTKGDSDTFNMYPNYRSYSVYYFVLNKNLSENHRYYISAINACDMNNPSGRKNGPFFITPRPNGSETHKTWSDIVAIYPQLSGKEHLFIYYPLTHKEKSSAELDNINFRRTDPNYFGRQHKDIQKSYILARRLIPDPQAFRTLPFNTPDNEDNLRKLYIAMTTFDDYSRRYKSQEAHDPFGLLNVIEKETPGLYRYLDEVILKTQLGIKKGVLAVKIHILGANYKPITFDLNNPTYVLYSDTSNEPASRVRYAGTPTNSNYGIMDLSNLTWVKNMSYTFTKAKGLIKGTSYFILKRYSSQNGDYFYFLFDRKEYSNPKSENYGKAAYYDKAEGDALLTSGEYRVLKDVK